jgi:hypothetical protein
MISSCHDIDRFVQLSDPPDHLDAAMAFVLYIHMWVSPLECLFDLGKRHDQASEQKT